MEENFNILKPIGPGGCGSSSGIVIVDNDLIVTIDCGGLRRFLIDENSTNKWTTDSDVPNNIRALLATEVNGKYYMFIGTNSGQIYRWDNILRT